MTFLTITYTLLLPFIRYMTFLTITYTLLLPFTRYMTFLTIAEREAMLPLISSISCTSQPASLAPLAASYGEYDNPLLTMTTFTKS